MNEFYWLTRLDGICVFMNVMLIISAIASVAFAVAYFLESMGEDEEYMSNIPGKMLKIFIPIFLLSAVARVFIPSTNEALMIWGIGGTIDYIKGNEKIKQIPDKCIDALDMWVNRLTEKEKEDL